MDSDTSAAHQLAPVQFSRLTRRGILLGLSLPQLVALSIAVLTVVISLYGAGATGIAWTSPIWATAAAIAAIPIGGRKIVEWVPIVSRWLWRAAHGQLTYRRRIVKPRPAGTLALPGDATVLLAGIEERERRMRHRDDRGEGLRVRVVDHDRT